ncbi:hypothetical protein EST38_g8434 [Candolleomyces aberdarensis]|uniref:Uncharacterized protein n=1 Tax=Candolleomyces aberdarensis TaxID=2316362 RepID=A0A4Q2DCG2_9AGAR|nr:hypothetical protein EST38_g8434 [Candolleomyces aberdarensis]
MDHSGILYHSYDSASGSFTAAQVPLEEVKVKVWIADGPSHNLGPEVL